MERSGLVKLRRQGERGSVERRGKLPLHGGDIVETGASYYRRPR